MKNKSNSRVVRVLSKILDIRTWFDWERMKSFTLFVGNGLRGLFMMDTENKKTTKDNLPLTESFNSAKQSLNLTDADLIIRQKALLKLSILMATIAILIFSYSIYQFFYGTLRAGFISLVIMMIAVALSFRYHFWYYQIKSHKLGCSVHEWFRKGLLGEKE
jgi:intracellular multiplication protein IcmV